MKKKVLFVTEASYLSTGYATYSRNIMEYLHSTGKYELAELSVYGGMNDPRRETIPWKNYPNMPDDNDEKQLEMYRSHHSNQFGAWRFERTCLDFEPDIVLTIRDFWMDSFIYNSPFRRIFSLCWMPTVDAAPQNVEWIHQFADADYVFTYSDWAGKVIEQQGGDMVNLCGTASPSAGKEFVPIGRKQAKRRLGIPEDIKIIGTVMRNQRRKLFPVLFKSFADYIHSNDIKDTYLYCHTSYPDGGWDLAELLNEYNIASRVLFSYICTECSSFETCLFHDSKKVCSNCNKYASVPCNVGHGLPNESLAVVYNSFDLYVQCANCEGFGIPMVEAAACGVPIACTNYSAMEDIIKKLNAYSIDVSAKYKELETGCERAVPNSEYLTEIFHGFFSTTEDQREIAGLKTRAAFEQNYSWEKSAKKWEAIIDECPYADWMTEPVIKPAVDIDISNPNLNNRDFVKMCVNCYLIDNTRIHSHEMRCLLRDLNAGNYKPSPDGFFHSEFTPFTPLRPMQVPLNRQMVMDMFKQRLEASNVWETVRIDRSKLLEEKWLD